jgi:hypothetical protein
VLLTSRLMKVAAAAGRPSETTIAWEALDRLGEVMLGVRTGLKEAVEGRLKWFEGGGT